MTSDLAAETSLAPARPEASEAPADVAAQDWPYDVQQVRADFPILRRRIHEGVPLVYLDSAATSQKPQAVLDAEREYNERHNANVHRGIHTLAEEATALYEGAREKVASFLGAADPREIVFTKNVTEGLNLLARSIGEGLRPGDEVVVTEMEHHSSLVPWQLACERSGATLRWFGLTEDGRLDLEPPTPKGSSTSAPRSSRSCIRATSSARSTRCGRSSRGRRRSAPSPSPTGLSRCRTGWSAWARGKVTSTARPGRWPSSASTSSASPATRCSARPASAGSGVVTTCLPSCLPSSAAARWSTSSPWRRRPMPSRRTASKPAPRRSRKPSGSARPSTISRRSASAGSPATSTSSPSTRSAGSPRSPGCASSGPRRPKVGARPSRSRCPVSIPTTPVSCSTSAGSPCGSGQHCARPVCLRYGVPATTRMSAHVYTTTCEVDALVEGLQKVVRFFSK